ncbi:DNA starvation/stationary phase protection protein [Oceanotoga sp. DSM 15011]|jgi:starvation-inducible DNA-binding protein|uniref:Starvation-inducible DNA-binding protein n=1 Tax=Oceanotoga teriensis TaxID=515440 RepID=A0AA45C691_9BACT|nr:MULTISPECIES: DNA starvation/stationary phase protection protein [Oceanotoga]MDN5343098.1 starvation-inducible DNA-binding protein [Oceanotoga sp.]PWJ91228.1 starvation-inducible DNA-binding protein [Oceanotoga teriensis]UYO99703.1 DNA starvation/stationary phase protection protein [Oceanotoga sp. DSM 15011]
MLLGIKNVKEIVEELNNYLADLNVFYGKLHNLHWNVEGKEFFTVHENVEKIYDKVNEEIDEIAERILTLGQRPKVKYSEYLEISNIKEIESKGYNGKEVIDVIISDFEYIINKIRNIIEKASENNDEVTADILTGSLAYYEKTAWMLNAMNK